jgi:hypothetical protein
MAADAPQGKAVIAGEALFENIQFGEYTITVHQGEKRLGHLLLAVKES